MRKLAVLVLLAAGCRPDEPVRRYSAPKDPVWRMLAAVVPAGGATYFLKTVGLTRKLDPHKADVLKLVSSLRFEAGQLRWAAPAGWEEEAGKGDRVATFRYGAGEPRLELAITRLDGDAGGLPANVNRWREQLGLGKVAEADLPKLTSTVDAGGLQATLVDLDGPHRPPTSMPVGPSMSGPPAPREERGSVEQIRSMFAFELPPGWTQTPEPGREVILEFHAGAGQKHARITLSALGGDAGGLEANVNRWRSQAGLDPVDEERAQRLVRIFTLFGQSGHYAEISGKDRSIHAAFTLGPPFSLFVKMDGAPETVNENKAAFEAFARTLRMNR
jgi:hypothetical protein